MGRVNVDLRGRDCRGSRHIEVGKDVDEEELCCTVEGRG